MDAFDRPQSRLPFPESLDPDPAPQPPRPHSSERAYFRRLPYPSDLSDEEWDRARRIIDPAGLRRKQRVHPREIVNAIRYRWRTGCPWRMLPHDFPAWSTVYAHFMQWQKHGTLAELRDALAARPRFDD